MAYLQKIGMRLKQQKIPTVYERVALFAVLTFLFVSVFGREWGISQAKKDWAQKRQAVVGLKFRLIKAASGTTDDGALFSVNVYRSSDGAIVSSRVDTFRTATAAQRELRTIVNTAKVVTSASDVSKKNERIRDRTVIVLPPEANEVYNEVLWSDKTKLHRLDSLSLQHLLEFERQFYP